MIFSSTYIYEHYVVTLLFFQRGCLNRKNFWYVFRLVERYREENFFRGVGKIVVMSMHRGGGAGAVLSTPKTVFLFLVVSLCKMISTLSLYWCPTHFIQLHKSNSVLSQLKLEIHCFAHCSLMNGNAYQALV